MNQTLKRFEIIKNKDIFQSLFKKGIRVSGKYLTILYLPANELRVGFTVTKKCRTAPKRNYVKRVLRELFRKNKPRFSKSIIIFHGHFCERIPFSFLYEDLNQILKNISVKKTHSCSH